MQGYFAVVALCMIVVFVLLRSRQMKSLGIKTVHFGRMDKKDFLIPPFILFYFYLIVANTFNLPKVGEVLDSNSLVAWIGAAVCAVAPALFLWGMISFGKSFRVGIDMSRPGSLVTTGAFSISRNPLYLAFCMIFAGVFMIFPTWIFFTYFVVGLWLVDRQVCLEENALRQIYGQEYDAYCEKVRRYI